MGQESSCSKLAIIKRNQDDMIQSFYKPQIQYLKYKYKQIKCNFISTHPNAHCRLGLTVLHSKDNYFHITSLIKCFLNIQPLADYFLNKLYLQDKGIHPSKLTHSLGDLMLTYWNCPFPIIYPKLILRIYKRRDLHSEECLQDALEFLLNSLHYDLNRIQDCKQRIIVLGNSDEDQARFQWGERLRSDQSIVVDLFTGQFRSRIVCSFCGNKELIFENFNYLELPVPYQKTCTLQQCLYGLTHQMIIMQSRRCNSCNSVINMQKRNAIWKLPPIILVYFQRRWKGKKSYAQIELEEWDPWELIEGTNKITGLYQFACGIFYGVHGHYSITLNRVTNKFYKHEINTIEQIEFDASEHPSLEFAVFYQSAQKEVFRQTDQNVHQWPHFSSTFRLTN